MRGLVWIVLLVVVIAMPGVNPCAASEEELRGWYFGWQMSAGQRNRYDVFGWEGLPTGTVEEPGRGNGLMVGHRFGERFLVGLQIVFSQHHISGNNDHIYDGEALVSGTVLFRQRDTFQPFLRGGFGGGAELIIFDEVSGEAVSYGTAAVAGGGLQVRLGDRFSLELETMATFSNFFEVSDKADNKPWPEDIWQVRTSNYGMRVGLGLLVWF